MSQQIKKSDPVGSLERGLLILHTLLDAPGPLSLADLSQKLDLAPSTVHRLLKTLIKFGGAVREPRGKRYLPAPQALAPLGFQHPITHLKLLSRSPLEKLRESTGETSACVLFVGYERLVLDFVIGRRKLAPNYQTWLQSPIHGSASGKLLLSSINEKYWSSLIGEEPYQGHAQYTITGFNELLSEIEEVRRKKHVVSINDGYENISAFGYPFYASGKMIGCITITVESDSLDSIKESFLINEMKRCVEKIETSSFSLKMVSDWLF